MHVHWLQMSIALLIFTVLAGVRYFLKMIFYWMNRAHRAEAANDPLRGEGPVIVGGRR